jgi:hypothetical protein
MYVKEKDIVFNVKSIVFGTWKVEAYFGNISVEDTGTDFEEMKEILITKLNNKIEEENSRRISEADDGYYLHLDNGE